MTNTTTSVLKSISFWGIVISNLLIGYFILFSEYYAIKYEPVNPFLIFCLLVMVTFFVLFKKVDFAKISEWKLMLYAFTVCIFIIFFRGFISRLLFEFDLSMALETAIWYGMSAFPFILLAPVINFVWLLIEKTITSIKETNNSKI